ncbi:MAG: hypothetical protein ABJB12_16055 [Pseudomonadota bacterium]
MHISPLAQRLLRLVFSLSSSAVALTRPRLEQRLGAARGALNEALGELHQLGLLDAQRLRLTLPGLACAVGLGARQPKRVARPIAQKTAPPRALHAPTPLFSEREAPRAVA